MQTFLPVWEHQYGRRFITRHTANTSGPIKEQQAARAKGRIQDSRHNGFYKRN